MWASSLSWAEASDVYGERHVEQNGQGSSTSSATTSQHDGH